MSYQNGKLHCDYFRECVSPVTHLDEKGFIYCAHHGALRKRKCRCRKLTGTELERLNSGKPIQSYDKASLVVDAEEKRIQELEAEGMTRSDAQGVVDAEQMAVKVPVQSVPKWRTLGMDDGLVARMVAEFSGFILDDEVRGSDLVEWLCNEMVALDGKVLCCMAEHGVPWDFEFNATDPGYRLCPTCGGVVEVTK